MPNVLLSFFVFFFFPQLFVRISLKKIPKDTKRYQKIPKDTNLFITAKYSGELFQTLVDYPIEQIKIRKMILKDTFTMSFFNDIIQYNKFKGIRKRYDKSRAD
jgi:hypothetical protein